MWVGSFISNRTTTLCLPDYNTDAFPSHTGIPQGSPLSLIIFLFYNAHFVNACNQGTSPFSGIGFVDDVNTLALGTALTLPTPLAALHGGPPLICPFLGKGLERSYRKLKTNASEPLLVPARPRQHGVSRQKWVYPRRPSTWTAGKPDFD